MSVEGKYVGESEIMARLQMPWRHICALVEHEGLPVKWIDDNCPVLPVADLEVWQASRRLVQ